MGITYSFTLRVGFALDHGEVQKKFEQKTPGEYHMEDRYDTKTGQKIKQVKVWDKHPVTVIMIDGEEVEDDGETIEAVLAEKLDCDVETSGSYSSGDFEYNFVPKRTGKYSSIDYGRIYLYNHSIPFQDVVAMGPELEAIKRKLITWGFNPGEPRVYVSSSIG